MKRMNSEEVRRAFLEYFGEHGHRAVSASSLVPGNDPTLLFTNAGMVQFKDVFLGIDQRPYSRATTAQKCMRISGKHNDLENVGPSPRHHTFFEMLGNFSFGDYFKREAITFAYELLTEVYGLPADRLAFTVYETDDDAYNIWTKEVGVSPKRVARMGAKTNFWQMAETGPCGPTSEIHWDLHPELGEDTILDALKREDDRFLELWNLVFMQYNRTQEDPTHSGQFDEPLPAPGVDTGMGMERLLSVMEEVESNYDTDLFTDIMDATQEILGHDDAFREEHYVAYRVIADHTRAAAFLVADGVNPGTTGREYVPRMLIRRAWRFAHGMGVDRPFLVDVADAVIHKMGDVYPELKQFREAVRYQIAAEEEQFMRTLDNSLARLDQQIAEMTEDGRTELNGREAFLLYATHGLPLELIRDVLKEHGMTVDEAGFQAEMAHHIAVSSAETGKFEDVSAYGTALDSLKELGALGEDGVRYFPYDYEQMGSFASNVVALFKDGTRVESAQRGDRVEVVLADTAFYVESGGQVSDTGTLRGDGWQVSVEDMRQPVGGLIVHVGTVTQGQVKEGERATGAVDTARRWDIMRNHTATHVLHRSLREVLGPHVRQKGSLVAPDRLRFDFTHNAPMTADEIDAVTRIANEIILANEPVEIVYKGLDEAKQGGAMALFGEKYGETVRTVTIPTPEDIKQRWSYELCGGTHIRMTAEIGQMIIVREESSSSGVRRIEAVTGHGAQALVRERLNTLNMAARILNAEPSALLDRIDGLFEELDTAEQRIEELERDEAREELEDVFQQAKHIDGTTLITAAVKAPDADLLGQMADWCRDRIDSGVVVLGSAQGERALLVAKVTPDLVARGVHAGKIVGDAAKVIGGGGGGRPDFATAGGKDGGKLPDALTKAEELITAMLG